MTKSYGFMRFMRQKPQKWQNIIGFYAFCDDKIHRILIPGFIQIPLVFTKMTKLCGFYGFCTKTTKTTKMTKFCGFYHFVQNPQKAQKSHNYCICLISVGGTSLADTPPRLHAGGFPCTRPRCGASPPRRRRHSHSQRASGKSLETIGKVCRALLQSIHFRRMIHATMR